MGQFKPEKGASSAPASREGRNGRQGSGAMTVAVIIMSLAVIVALSYTIYAMMREVPAQSSAIGGHQAKNRANQALQQGVGIWHAFPNDGHAEKWFSEDEWDFITDRRALDMDPDAALAAKPNLMAIYANNSSNGNQAEALNAYILKVVATRAWPEGYPEFGTPETSVTNPKLWARTTLIAHQYVSLMPGEWELADIYFPTGDSDEDGESILVTFVGASEEYAGMTLQYSRDPSKDEPSVTEEGQDRHDAAMALYDALAARPELADADWYLVMTPQSPLLVVNTMSDPDVTESKDELLAMFDDTFAPAGFKSGVLGFVQWDGDNPMVLYESKFEATRGASRFLSNFDADADERRTRAQAYLLSGQCKLIMDSDSIEGTEWQAPQASAGEAQPPRPAPSSIEPVLTAGDPSRSPAETIANTGTFVTGPGRIGTSSDDGPYHCYWLRNYGNGMVVSIAQLLYMPDGAEPDGILNDGIVAKINKYSTPTLARTGFTEETGTGIRYGRHLSQDGKATCISWARDDSSGMLWRYDLYLYEEIGDEEIEKVLDSTI